MAKSTPATQTAEAWTVDDIGRVNEQVEALAGTITRLTNLIEQLEARLLVIEKKTVHLDVSERTLPSHVVAGLTHGQVYQSALQAAIIGEFMSKPMLTSIQKSHRVAYINNCLDFAYETVQQLSARTP
jgi:hypothetical protein